MQSFIVNSEGYKVYIGDVYDRIRALLKEKGYSKVFILTDTHTGDKCLPKFIEKLPEASEFSPIEVPAGEAHKTIVHCNGIWEKLLEQEADRNSLLINLGGGMITDMGSFAASTYKRGIDFVQIPTSLLAQVDASVGGKTGIDMNRVKNIVGTFTNPEAVYIDTGYLYTLPERELWAGFAEMIKHGLICDSKYYFDLQTNAMGSIDNHMIFRSVDIKNKIVLEDPREKGSRKALNFGHTIGHAVESYSLENDEDPLLHGEAIAIGMICESYLSLQKAGLKEGALQDIQKFLLKYYPSRNFPESGFAKLIGLMRKDKKNRGDEINFTMLSKIGAFTVDQSCREDEITEALRYYNSLQS